MKALDTNVLIRFLVRDDEQQAGVIYNIFKQAESAKSGFFVPMPVVLEMLWVLESVYKTPRKKILDAIGELLLMPVLKFEAQPAIIDFISSAHETKTDLPDLLIAASAKLSGCESILTFDKKASNFPFFELLTNMPR